MQSKINSFFKSGFTSASRKQAIDLQENLFDDEEDFTREPEIPIIYTRRSPKTYGEDDGALEWDDKNKFDIGEQLVVSNSKRVSNKKRKYAQFHLDLGQSDFMFRYCKTCGFKFVPGDEEDDKLHKGFHKNYTHGIGLKGWRNERVINMHSLGDWRVILVLNDDTPAHVKKVEEVIKMMEMELGDGWIFHKHCLSFYILPESCWLLVAEPIKRHIGYFET